jgi:hypothetical protein
MNFVTDEKGARVCPACKWKTKERSKKTKSEKYKKFKPKPKPKTTNYTIAQICRMLEEYNRKHNTYISYGEFVKMLEDGNTNFEDLLI